MPVTESNEIAQQLDEFLKKLLSLARLNLKFKVKTGGAGTSESPEVTVDFSGEDTDILLQHSGELMEALEEVSVRFLRLPIDERGKVGFDCNDYKSLRKEELRLTAEAAAEKAIHSGAPFSLNPMNSRDRRIIHLALKDNPAVRTESPGVGSRRNVVIVPVEGKH